MRVLVTGAYGLIGNHVCARLLRDGNHVIGVGRDTVQARRRMPRIQWRQADLARMTAQDWLPILDGVDAVVNCAGALQDSPRDNLAALHVDGVIALARACEGAGIRRFVQISAVGVTTGDGAFSRTKLAADTAIAALDLDWIILRPALVLAPAAFGGSALLRGLAACPLAIPAIHADAVVQVVSVEDVSDAVARALRPGSPNRFTCDLGAPEPTRLHDILGALRGWLGLPPAPVLRVPVAAGRAAASVADALAWLGWRSPMRTAAITQLSQGVRANAEDAPRLLGLHPRALPDILDGSPSGVQERWFARLYFAKPLILATLAAFWIVSGVIGLLRLHAAASVLTDAGMGEGIALLQVIIGAFVDLAVGAAICHRRTAAAGLWAAIAVTAAYLLGATAFRPDLWSDPLGPLVKIIPAAALALCALAILDER